METNFRVFGSLDFHKGRLAQDAQAPRDLSLAASSGADHQDILGHHLHQ